MNVCFLVWADTTALWLETLLNVTTPTQIGKQLDNFLLNNNYFLLGHFAKPQLCGIRGQALIHYLL